MFNSKIKWKDNLGNMKLIDNILNFRTVFRLWSIHVYLCWYVISEIIIPKRLGSKNTWQRKSSLVNPYHVPCHVDHQWPTFPWVARKLTSVKQTIVKSGRNPTNEYVLRDHDYFCLNFKFPQLKRVETSAIPSQSGRRSWAGVFDVSNWMRTDLSSLLN